MSVALSRLRPARPTGHRHLLTGSAVLVVGAGIQAATGFVFWLVAAKIDSKVDVGNATALYTSVLFCAYLAGLGLPVALARYSADRSRSSEVIFTWGATATVVSSVVAALGYLAVIHAMGVDAAEVLFGFHPVLGPLLFVVMVAGAALSLIVDVRCMTMRRWNLVMARIALVGLSRVPLLYLAQDSGDRALWLFVFASGTTAVSGILGAIWVPRVADGRHHVAPRPPTVRPAVRYSLVNYLSTLGYQAPYFALPVIVLASVDADVNAAFYVAWGIVSVVFYVPSAIGQALLAEGGKDGAQVRAQTRLSLMLALALMSAGTVVAFFGSGLVETVYGPEYHDAARVLPAMMAAGIPWAVTSMELTEARVRHRSVVTVLITVVLTTSIIVPALILVPGSGPGHGLDGASKSWLLGNLLAAVVAVIASRVRASSRTTGELADPVTEAAMLAGTADEPEPARLRTVVR